MSVQVRDTMAIVPDVHERSRPWFSTSWARPIDAHRLPSCMSVHARLHLEQAKDAQGASAETLELLSAVSGRASGAIDVHHWIDCTIGVGRTFGVRHCSVRMTVHACLHREQARSARDPSAVTLAISSAVSQQGEQRLKCISEDAGTCGRTFRSKRASSEVRHLSHRKSPFSFAEIFASPSAIPFLVL